MENAETILVIFLSTFLALFLLLSIIATVKLIQILNHVKAISEKAEVIADKAQAATEYITNTAESLSIVKLFANVIDVVSKRKTNKK